jgi:CRISPR-associated endoribonuclease Cas6
MKFYELVVTAMLTEDILYNKSYEKLSQLINLAMYQDEQLKQRHLLYKTYKFYNFSSLYPTEKDKIYKKGKVYIFTIRSADEYFANTIKKCLKIASNNGSIVTVASELIEKKSQFISELRSVTPAVITNGRDNHWKPGEDFNVLQDNINKNAKYKYEKFFDKEIGIAGSFFYGIEVLNNSPIFVSYKTGCLIGNKFKLLINPDELSQELATMCLSSGLGIKNSIGMGFCHAH